MNSKLRRGAILFAGYFLLLGLESLWIAAGPRWFGSAREWAAMHPPHTPAWQIAVSTIGFAVAWAVGRGHRWAWYVAVVWLGIISTGAVVLLAAAASRSGLVWTLVASHPAEAVSGLIQVGCAAGGLGYLCCRQTRDSVFPTVHTALPEADSPQGL